MASTINGTSTGSGGLISTGDDSGILNIQTNETTAITVDASQNTTFAGKVTSAGALTLASNGTTTAVTIDTSQNVLIATTNAITGITGVQLTVSNTSENPAYINIFRDDTTIGNGQFLGYLQFCGRDATSSLGTAHAYVGAVAEADHGAGDNATAITFGTTPDNSSSMAERMRIDSIGNLLVGTSAPFNFSAAGGGTFQTASSDGQLFLRNSGASANFGWYLGANSSNQMRIYNQSGSGVLLTNGSTSWSSTSDERLKTDLAPIQDSLQKVSALRAVTGRFKTDEEGVSRSFLIAQDFENVFPQALDASDEDALSLKYTEVIPLLVASIKDLKAINDTQAETINALTARIVALEGQ